MMISALKVGDLQDRRAGGGGQLEGQRIQVESVALT